MSGPGVVYLLKPDKMPYKIGHAKEASTRASVLGVLLPYPSKVLHCVDAEDSKKAEGYFHALFAAKRLNGEWFNLSDADVVAFKSVKVWTRDMVPPPAEVAFPMRRGVPKEPTVIRLTGEARSMLRALADKNGQTVAGYMENLIRREAKREKVEPAE